MDRDGTAGKCSDPVSSKRAGAYNEIYSGAVGDEEVVSPANIGIDSDSSKGESDDDLNPQPTSSVQALLRACWTKMALRGNAPIQ